MTSLSAETSPALLSLQSQDLESPVVSPQQSQENLPGIADSTLRGLARDPSSEPEAVVPNSAMQPLVPHSVRAVEQGDGGQPTVNGAELSTDPSSSGATAPSTVGYLTTPAQVETQDLNLIPRFFDQLPLPPLPPLPGPEQMLPGSSVESFNQNISAYVDSRVQGEQPFVLPVSNAVITSRIGWREGGFHFGTDYAAPVGTPVVLPTEMTITRVVQTGYNGGAGTYAEAVDANGYRYQFMHGIPNSIVLSEGRTYPAGTQLMQIGMSGRTTGPHLHFSAVAPDGTLLDLTLPPTSRATYDVGGRTVARRGASDLLNNSEVSPDIDRIDTWRQMALGQQAPLERGSYSHMWSHLVNMYGHLYSARPDIFQAAGTNYPHPSTLSLSPTETPGVIQLLNTLRQNEGLPRPESINPNLAVLPSDIAFLFSALEPVHDTVTALPGTPDAILVATRLNADIASRRSPSAPIPPTGLAAADLEPEVVNTAQVLLSRPSDLNLTWNEALSEPDVLKQVRSLLRFSVDNFSQPGMVSEDLRSQLDQQYGRLRNSYNESNVLNIDDISAVGYLRAIAQANGISTGSGLSPTQADVRAFLELYERLNNLSSD